MTEANDPERHPHANIAGRERELEALADAVRRLVNVTVTNDANAARTAEMAAALASLADEYEAELPATAPSRYPAASGAPRCPDDVFPYDVVLGRFNPLALPLAMEWRDPRAIGRASFTTAYEGPPGCVHGGVLAAAFDQVFNVANIMAGKTGPTRSLALRYRRPSPLLRELEFEGWVESADERTIVSKGVARYEGRVTVEAEGHFARLSPETIQAMSERARKRS